MSAREVSTLWCSTSEMLKPLQPELELVGGDAAHVEQVVDQPHQMAQLPADHLMRVGGGLGGDRVGLEDLQPGADRGQGVAQFVGERGQELVLAAIGFAQPPLAGVQLAVGLLERLGAFADALFELGEQPVAQQLEGVETGQRPPDDGGERHGEGDDDEAGGEPGIQVPRSTGPAPGRARAAA